LKFLTIISGIVFASSMYGQIISDVPIAGEVVPVLRTVTVNYEDCAKNWKTYSCVVTANESQPLLATQVMAESKTIIYRVGSVEKIEVVYQPLSNGYTLTVYPGSLSGPYLRYVRSAFARLDDEFLVNGLMVKLND
jgi:hypothetical protein